MVKSFRFHSDASHGWLVVPLIDVVHAGIAAEISSCSYIKNEDGVHHAYLEEDCDAGIYLDTLKAKGITPKFVEDFVSHSYIRDYPSFTQVLECE